MTDECKNGKHLEGSSSDLVIRVDKKEKQRKRQYSSRPSRVSKQGPLEYNSRASRLLYPVR